MPLPNERTALAAGPAARVLLIGLLVMLGALPPAGAQNAASGPARPESPAPLRIAVASDYPPFSLVGPGDQPYGLLIDLWRHWSEVTGTPVEFVPGTWMESLEGLREGRVDLHAGLFENPERAQWMIFSEALGHIPSTIYTRSGPGKVPNLEDLAGRRVAVVGGTHQEAYLRRNHPAIEVVPRASTAEAVNALLLAEVDALFGEVPPIEAVLQRLGLPGAVVRHPRAILRNQFKAGALKGREALIHGVNEGFAAVPAERLIEAERRWLTAARDRYFEARAAAAQARPTGIGAPGAAPDLTPEERAWIRANPGVTVAIMEAWPPLDFKAPNGQPSGIGVDVLTLMAGRVGLDVRIVAGPFKDNIEAVRDRKLDALLDVTPKPDREEYLHFTQPYLTIPHVLIARTDGPHYGGEAELAGRTVAIEEGFFAANYLRENYPEVIVREFADTAACLVAVSRGEADAYIGNRAVALYVIAQQLLLNLEIMAELRHTSSVLAIGVRRDRPELAQILDKALATVTPAEMLAILRKWSGEVDAPVRIELTAEERDWIGAHPVVRVAATQDWPPFEYRDAAGQYVGISSDVFRLAAQRAGLQAEFTLDAWPVLLEKLRAGELDLAPGMSPSPQREADFVFTRPYLTSLIGIWVRSSTRDVGDVEDLQDRTVAIEDGHFLTDVLREKYPDIRQLPVKSTLEALKAVSTGEADAYMGTHAAGAYLIERYLFENLTLVGYMDERPLELAFGIRKNAPLLRDILQKALDSITQQEIQDIQGLYLGSDAEFEAELVLTDEERAWLEEHRNLRLGVDPAWLPFEAINADGEHLGVVSEYIRWVDAKLGTSMVPVPGLSWAQVVERAKAGEIDVIAGMTRSPEREQFMLFTQPYLRMPMILVTRQDAPFIAGLDDLAGRRVAVVEGYVTEEYLRSEYPAVEVRGYANVSECLVAVADGQVDAAFDNLGSVTYTIRSEELEGLKVAATTTQNFELSIAVRKDWPELVTILDKALSTLPKRTRESFYDRWVNVRVQSRVDWGVVWRAALGVAGVGVLLLGLALVWNRRLAGEIEERRRAQDALNEALGRIQSIMTSMGEGIVGVDPGGRIRFVNPAASAVLGYAPGEIEGRTLHDLIHYAREDGSPYPVEDCPMTRACARGEQRNVSDEVFWRKDGQCFPVEYTAAPIRSDGTIAGAVVVFRDITERRKMQQEILAAKEKAEEATRAKSDFLANMSHEIRTPMNAIMGMTHLAQRTELTPRQQDYLSKISTSAMSLLRIINDILDFSKIEAGRMELERTEFHLEDVLDNLGSLIQVETEEKGLELLFHVGQDVPLSLVGDPLRLGQVLINLAGNAVKFTEKGEIVIDVQTTGTAGDGAFLKFSVRDTGIGMTEAQRHKLFQAFSQADTSTTRKFGGTGLGLVICKRLVDLMGGEIGVESTPGKGSTFWFTARFGLHDKERPRARHLAEDFRGMHVLVVDDNQPSRTFLSEALASMGFEPVTARSGPEALEILQRAADTDPIQLVLMDWKMPGMDGIETTRRIKGDTGLPVLPTIIMVTAYGREEVMKQAEEVGMAGFLVKPVIQSVLFDTIMEAFGRPVDRRRRLGRRVEAEQEGLRHIRGARILLVEDSEINRQVATELLEQADLVVRSVTNGQEAVDAVAAESFDAVLMDIQMPVMDGYEATRHIRNDERFRDLPIIAMTANAMAGDREKSLAAGMNDHVNKPVDPAELFAALIRWIKPGTREVPSELLERRAARDAVAQPALHLSGFDTVRALERMGGNTQAYLKTLGKVVESEADAMVRARAHLAAGDRESATRVVHTLKGVAGNIGARALQDAAGRLESILAREGAALPETLMLRTERELDTAIAAIRSALSRNETPAAASAAQPADIRPLLEELREQIESFDSSAADTCQALLGQLADPAQLTLGQALGKALDTYEFEKAQALLDNLIHEIETKRA